MKPPSANNINLVAVSNTVSATIPTGAGGTETVIAMISDGPFDVVFSDDGTSTVPNPPVPTAGKGIFGAGIVHRFDLGPKNSHFKVVAGNPGALKWWRASRT